MKMQLLFLLCKEQVKGCRAVTPHSLLSSAVMDGELKLQSWHYRRYQAAFNKWVLNESNMCSSEQGTSSETAMMNKMMNK
jgi:hypothetical protein